MARIVIIEDHPVLISVYRNKFVAEGFEVEIASDGESGLRLIDRVKPNLVVLDLAMPKVNGLEVLRRLRAHPSFETLPVIIFSDSAWKQQALKEGATVVLSKSKHSPSQVVEAVRAALLTFESLQSDDSTATNAGVIAAASTSSKGVTDSRRTEGRVLLVEDHEDLRATISAALKQSGFQVTGVETHAAAWHQIDAREFDAYLINRVCPDGLGLSLCRKLRDLYAHKTIVLYSTVAIAISPEQRMNAGASAYLTEAAEMLNPGRILSKLINDERSMPGRASKRADELSMITA